MLLISTVLRCQNCGSKKVLPPAQYPDISVTEIFKEATMEYQRSTCETHHCCNSLQWGVFEIVGLEVK